MLLYRLSIICSLNRGKSKPKRQNRVNIIPYKTSIFVCNNSACIIFLNDFKSNRNKIDTENIV